QRDGHVLRGIDTRIAVGVYVPVLEPYVYYLAWRQNGMRYCQRARIAIGIRLGEVVGNVIVRGGLAVQDRGVEHGLKVYCFLAVAVCITKVHGVRNVARDGTAEVDIEMGIIKTGAAGAVLDARPHTLRGGKVDELYATGDLAAGKAKNCLFLRLEIAYGEIQRVLRAQNFVIVVGQNKGAVRVPVIALVHVRGRVGNGLGCQYKINLSDSVAT